MPANPPGPYAWMCARLRDERGRYTDTGGCCLLTELVEDYDAEILNGRSTLDPDHPAWDAAVRAAERVGGFNQ